MEENAQAFISAHLEPKMNTIRALQAEVKELKDKLHSAKTTPEKTTTTNRPVSSLVSGLPGISLYPKPHQSQKTVTHEKGGRSLFSKNFGS